jgi:hypothetical protein
MNKKSYERKFKTERISANLNSWDYELNYQETYSNLISEIFKVSGKFAEGQVSINKLKGFTFMLCGIIQLRNGSRIGEAVEALIKFCLEPKKDLVQVRVQKRKDDFYRSMVRPEELNAWDLEYAAKIILSQKILIPVISRFFRYNFGFSTHGLRHSFITYMGVEKKEPATTLAIITGHKDLNQLMNYINTKSANRHLRNVNNFRLRVNLPVIPQREQAPLRVVK